MSDARNPSGFTLIEMLISLAAGSAIVVVATAGFRAATQSLTAVNRIATGNAMLVAGFEAATNEVDFWTSIDQPNDPARQPMRGKKPGKNGFLPFAPFKNSDFLAPITEVSMPNEDTVGWSPHPMAWSAADPRTWTRHSAQVAWSENNVKEYGARAVSALPWGNWTLFSHVKPTAGDPKMPAHHWYDGQVRGLLNSLGFYGLCDYLPSNAHFVYAGDKAPADAPDSLSFFGIPACLLDHVGWLGLPIGHDGTNAGTGRVTCSLGGRPVDFPSAIAFADPPISGYLFESWNVGSIEPLNPRYRPVFGLEWFRWYVDRDQRIKDFRSSLLNNQRLNLSIRAMTNYPPMMEGIPSSWPDVSAKVLRLIDAGRVMNISVLDFIDPATGERFSTPFTCMGTSLRGARQQRRPDRGWVINPKDDATLDYDVAP